MECSQPAAWTMNRCLLVAYRVLVFSGRPTIFGSSIPTDSHVESGGNGCQQCLQLALWNCFEVNQLVTNPSWHCHARIIITISIIALTQTTIAITNYTHALTVINSFAFHALLYLALHSVTSGVCGNSTTTSSKHYSFGKSYLQKAKLTEAKNSYIVRLNI